MREQKNLFDKYLQLLGVEKAFPTFELLRQIIKSHLIKIPLENIPKVFQDKFGMPAEKVSEAVIRIKKLKNIFD